MDVVYTLKYDALSGINQLIYSLRSIDKYLIGFRNVYVIGASPGDLKVIHIPATDLNTAAKNIMDKMLIACNHPDISENFLYIADDHFLLQSANISNYPYYTDGSLQELYSRQQNGYKAVVQNTIDALNGKAQRNYNIHCPIIYNKKMLKEVVSQYDWNKPKAYLLKSLYCNHLDLYQRNELKDLKISRNLPPDHIMTKIKDRTVFSTGKEFKCEEVMKILKRLFPEKSRFE